MIIIELHDRVDVLDGFVTLVFDLEGESHSSATEMPVDLNRFYAAKIQIHWLSTGIVLGDEFDLVALDVFRISATIVNYSTRPSTVKSDTWSRWNVALRLSYTSLWEENVGRDVFSSRLSRPTSVLTASTALRIPFCTRFAVRSVPSLSWS